MLRPQTEEAYDLLHQGASALAQIEHNGIRIDTARLAVTMRKTQNKINRIKEDLQDTEVWRTWRKAFGASATLSSKPQLDKVLFEIMGYTSKAQTKTGRNKTDIEALSHVDDPFIAGYLHLGKLEKLHGTYLKGLERETIDGYLHPFFHLHKVISYRSSSSDPNFQNFPIREPETAELLRSLIIPRDGHLIIENDFKGIEVCTAGIYTGDKVLIDYIKDTSKDMHRDCAMRLFCINDKKDVEKTVRHSAKSNFVFASFYGSDYINTTQRLWQDMEDFALTVQGIPMREWLARHGIREMGDCNDRRNGPREGTFEKHVYEFEQWYWHTQYAGYTAWKKRRYEEYLRDGGFASLTGFYWEGLFDRNQVLNYPIQGTAFHMLLWTLIRMQSWLVKNKMRSRIVGQIHDSIIGDVHASEKDDYLAKIKELVTTRLPQYWDWICVPMTIEAEVTPVDGNWFLKKEIKL